MPFFEVNHSGFDKLKRSGFSTNRAIADLFGVDPATLSRVLRGEHPPSTAMIAGTLATLGKAWLDDLFNVVDERRPPVCPANPIRSARRRG